MNIDPHRSHAPAAQLKPRPQSSSLPPAPRNFPQIQFQRFGSKSRLDYRYGSKCFKDMITSGFVSPLVASQQHMPQLLPRGEGFPGGTLHHTPRVCFGGPSLAPLQQKLPRREPTEHPSGASLGSSV